MINSKMFCTCSFEDCPLHPHNHEQGCGPCIAKNLKNREIPNCFFNMVDGLDKRKGYTFFDFAEAVTESQNT